MSEWLEIRALPYEQQAQAREAVERRAGPFRPAQPQSPRCLHPVELHTTWGDTTWCPLCSDDADDRARAVLAWLRTQSSTNRLLAAHLGLEVADVRELVRRLAAGGLVRCIGHVAEDTEGGLQPTGVWRAS